MDPKFDALMMQNFHGEVLGDPDLAGVFDFLSSPKFTRTLRVGSKGDDVKYMQKMLGITQTGVFDATTQNAVASVLGQTDPFDPKYGVIDSAAWEIIKTGGKKARTAQTGSDILAIGGSIFDALRQPAVVPTVPETTTEPETNWLLYGGLAIGAVVLVGGIILLTRD